MSRSRAAALTSLHFQDPDDAPDERWIKTLETDRRTLPPRRLLEPYAQTLGLTWGEVLELV